MALGAGTIIATTFRIDELPFAFNWAKIGEIRQIGFWCRVLWLKPALSTVNMCFSMILVGALLDIPLVTASRVVSPYVRACRQCSTAS